MSFETLSRIVHHAYRQDYVTRRLGTVLKKIGDQKQNLQDLDNIKIFWANKCNKHNLTSSKLEHLGEANQSDKTRKANARA